MRSFRLAACMFATGCVSLSAAEALYTAELLDFQHHALDINDHGELAGEYRGTIQHGIYFDGTRWIPRGNGDHYSWSALYAINNNHAAVGLNAIPPQPSGSIAVHAVRVEPGGAIINLGSLTGENGNAKARGINDLNVAVGDSLNAGGKRVAVRFETNGVVSDLSLPVDSSSAIEINNRGDIAGESISSSGLIRGFFIPWDGIMKDIGTLGGTETFVVRMNARGTIVGRSKTSSGDTHAFVYSDGQMTDLGTFGGKESAAYGINDAGVIVGGATKTNGAWRPFIKYPGQPMMDLGDVVQLPPPDAAVLATAINNRGQIIVRGMYNESNYVLKTGALTLEAAGDRLRLRFVGPENLRVRIDSADILQNWRPISTNTLNSEPITIEAIRTDETAFFRAVLFADE